MNKYLVTGGSGFIGTNLVDSHLLSGDIVLSIDIVPPRKVNHNLVYQEVDLLSLPALEAVITSFAPTHVYHLGARTDLDGLSLKDYEQNTIGTENLIAALQKAESVERVIFASSRLVCAIGYNPKNFKDYCPTTPYGESKVLCENIVNDRSDMAWSWCIVRPTSIWGPWFGVPYRNFFDMIKKGIYFHPKGFRVLKSFGFVGNAVFELKSLMHAFPEKINNKTFYIGDYEPIDVYEFSREIARNFMISSPVEVPIYILRALAVLGDLFSKIGWSAPLTTFRLNNLTAVMQHDFTDLREVVGDLPYSISEGVKVTVDWMESHER